MSERNRPGLKSTGFITISSRPRGINKNAQSRMCQTAQHLLRFQETRFFGCHWRPRILMLHEIMNEKTIYGKHAFFFCNPSNEIGPIRSRRRVLPDLNFDRGVGNRDIQLRGAKTTKTRIITFPLVLDTFRSHFGGRP